MYACLAVTCHLHFWQNDRDFLRATVVTQGWNGYRNKSQHRKLTLEKKILLLFLQGFRPATFQSRVQHSNHWAIPTPIAPSAPIGWQEKGLWTPQNTCRLNTQTPVSPSHTQPYWHRMSLPEFRKKGGELSRLEPHSKSSLPCRDDARRSLMPLPDGCTLANSRECLFWCLPNEMSIIYSPDLQLKQSVNCLENHFQSKLSIIYSCFWTIYFTDDVFQCMPSSMCSLTLL